MVVQLEYIARETIGIPVVSLSERSLTREITTSGLRSRVLDIYSHKPLVQQPSGTDMIWAQTNHCSNNAPRSRPSEVGPAALLKVTTLLSTYVIKVMGAGLGCWDHDIGNFR